jgi:hypothetical protein
MTWTEHVWCLFHQQTLLQVQQLIEKNADCADDMNGCCCCCWKGLQKGALTGCTLGLLQAVGQHLLHGMPTSTSIKGSTGSHTCRDFPALNLLIPSINSGRSMYV